MTHLDSDVIKRETFPVMVDAYDTACKEIDQAFQLFETAKLRLRSAFGSGQTFDVVQELRYHSNTPEGIKKNIKKNAWQAFLDRLEVKKFMSIKDLEKLEKSFEDVNNIPEITVETLVEIQTGLMNTAPDYAKAMALEAYSILLPGASERNHFKTNEKYARGKLGKKIILSWYIDYGYGGTFHVNSYHEKHLMCIDKVFHVLDGKGVPKGYNTPLINAINSTPHNVGHGETDYFRFKCYQNNNLHVDFKRMDLVKKLNKIAGDNTRIG
ncbi:MAG: DUF4942 domain-containing protein [Clostridia bacterium]|jgi:hypothetical protein